MGIDWESTLTMLGRLLGAYLLAMPIGYEREASERTMGLRTFPLVALASAGYLMLGNRLFGPDANAQARVLEGLVTGIGFIGAGAILKLRGEEAVHGTATAASVWATGRSVPPLHMASTSSASASRRSPTPPFAG